MKSNDDYDKNMIAALKKIILYLILLLRGLNLIKKWY